jgi:hypothetical protein
MTSDGAVATVDAGPRRISRRVSVGASAVDLFAIIADPRRHGEWDGSGTVGDAVKVEGPLRPGARFSVRMHQFGLPYRITSTVTAYEDGRLLEWRHPAGHRWRYEFSETAPGRTEVTETWDYSTSRAPKVLELLGMPARNTAGIEATLAKLRARFP